MKNFSTVLAQCCLRNQLRISETQKSINARGRKFERLGRLNIREYLCVESIAVGCSLSEKWLGIYRRLEGKWVRASVLNSQLEERILERLIMMLRAS